MSHAYAARGARQTAVLAAIIGLHFAVFLAVITTTGVIRDVLEPDPPIIDVFPEPEKPKPEQAKPLPGEPEKFVPGLYPEPDVPLPDFNADAQDGPSVPPYPDIGADSDAGSGPYIVEVLQPKLRTRQAKVDAAINACYPAASRRMNEEGKVVALVSIGANGKAVNWNVAQSSGFARLDSAIACVLQKLDFVPGRRDGQAVLMDAQLPIVFQLD